MNQESIESILKNGIDKDPAKYTPENISRVITVMEYIKKYPEKKHPYKLLLDINDIQLYCQAQDWENKNTSEIINNKDTDRDAYCFYMFIHRRAKEMSNGNKKIQKNIIRSVFKGMHDDISQYTLDDWIKKHNAHPEWEGLTPKEVREDIKGGGNSFYFLCNKWIGNMTKDHKYHKKNYQEYREELIKKIYNPRTYRLHKI